MAFTLLRETRVWSPFLGLNGSYCPFSSRVRRPENIYGQRSTCLSGTTLALLWKVTWAADVLHSSSLLAISS